MLLSRYELAVCRAARELGFGSLFPDEPDQDGYQEYPVNPAELGLVRAMRDLGPPREIKVADGRPVYALFPVNTLAGRAEKRIQFV